MRFENLIALGAFAPTALVHGVCLPIDADHPGARPGFIPELGLNLVNHERVARIRSGVIAHQLHGGFLVGHRP